MPKLTRRTVLAGAGLGALAVAGAVPSPTHAAPSAAGSLPVSARFPLAAQPSDDLFRHAVLAGNRVQQSFAFDSVRQAIFVAQLADGSSDASGHLTISRLRYDGSLYSSMQVLSAGHGVNIAAESAGSGVTYLWTEAEAAGADVEYTPVPGEHILAAYTAVGPALDWVDDRARGVPFTAGCR